MGTKSGAVFLWSLKRKQAVLGRFREQRRKMRWKEGKEHQEKEEVVIGEMDPWDS